MSTILRAYKFRLYPNEDQILLLNQFFGAKRFIFNHYLHENKQRFMRKEKILNNFDINKEITILKKVEETAWLKSIDDWALKNASEDLHNAYQNFFNTIKGKSKQKSKLPNFKNKHSKQSYRTRGIKVDHDKNRVFVPKIKWIEAKVHRQFEGIIKSATITRNKSHQFYISILVEEVPNLLKSTGIEIGIDLGLKDLMILSNGLKFQNPKIQLEKANRALKKQQRKFAKTKKDSKNHEHQRLKVAKCYQRISDIRNNYYHEISRYLVNNYDAIYMEDLNVKGMMKNKKLSRTIQEASWSSLVSMIAYKASWSGKTFHQINRFIASSKTCSCCGFKLDKLNLSQRDWQCPSCLTNHDRDLNAAINIKNFGQKDCYDQILEISSQAIGEVEEIPMALQKMTIKIERSTMFVVCHGREQARCSLDI